MTQEKQYYCSSPALDWRLSGRNTVEGELRPDPLIYYTEASVTHLFRHTDPYTGLGKLPPLSTLPTEVLKIPLKQPSKATFVSSKLPQTKTSDSKSTTSVGEKTSTESMTENPLTTAESTGKVPSTPPSKAARKSKSSLSASPHKLSSPSSAKKQNKWCAEEEKCIVKALITSGEKGIDWVAVLKDINALRHIDEPRTMKSVKMHWSAQMKPALLSWTIRVRSRITDVTLYPPFSSEIRT